MFSWDCILTTHNLKCSFILFPIGWGFNIWWRNRSNAHPREMVPRLFGLLLEFPQHHARSRCGGRIFNASGENFNQKYTFLCWKCRFGRHNKIKEQRAQKINICQNPIRHLIFHTSCGWWFLFPIDVKKEVARK